MKPTPYQIASDGRVEMPYLEFYVTKGCNLKCAQCVHFSPYRKGIIPATEVFDWITTWSKKIMPSEICIMGGEPLLHPELDVILRATRYGWPDTRIVLATNGLLLTEMKKELFDTIRSMNVVVSIFQNQDEPEFNKRFRANVCRIDRIDVRYCVFAAYEYWKKHYDLSSTGLPRPFSSDPATAFENCLEKRRHNLFNNRLHRCSFLRNAYEAYREKALNEEWKIVDEILTLSPDCSPEEIARFLCSGPFEACAICPEQKKPIPATQMDFSETENMHQR